MEKYVFKLFNLEEGKDVLEFEALKNESRNTLPGKDKVVITTSFFIKNRSSEDVHISEDIKEVAKASWQEQWVRCEILRVPQKQPGKTQNIASI